MRDQLPHQLPALDPRARIGIVVCRHVEQRLAAQCGRLARILRRVVRGAGASRHRAALEQIDILPVGDHSTACLEFHVERQAVAQLLQQCLLEAPQFRRVRSAAGQGKSGISGIYIDAHGEVAGVGINPGGILAIADLYKEDGSFHDGDMNVHRGFDPEELTAMLHQQGFHEIKIAPCFVIRKEIPTAEIKEYPVFLLTANR